MMRRNANINVLHLVPAVSRDMEGKKDWNCTRLVLVFWWYEYVHEKD